MTNERNLFHIRDICLAYESGFGHGLQADADRARNPYAEFSDASLAYGFGYEAGFNKRHETTTSGQRVLAVAPEPPPHLAHHRGAVVAAHEPKARQPSAFDQATPYQPSRDLSQHKDGCAALGSPNYVYPPCDCGAENRQAESPAEPRCHCATLHYEGCAYAEWAKSHLSLGEPKAPYCSCQQFAESRTCEHVNRGAGP